MNFEDDIRQQVLDRLPHDKHVDAELRAKSASDLLLIYANWCSRFIAPLPRTVHCSRALTCNPKSKSAEFATGLEMIIAKLERGIDITPHLSRRIRYGHKRTDPSKPKALDRRKDLDLMLNDWGIHHLHLSTLLESNGFVKRTKPLLFAILKPADAYLINIAEHGAWTHTHIIEIVVEEWPDAGLVNELKGVLPAKEALSDAQRRSFRKVGVNATITVAGRAYFPSAGLTSAGTAVSTTFTVMRLFRALKQFEERLHAEPEFVAKAMVANGVVPPSTLDLHFSFFEQGGCGVIERTTGFGFSV